MILKSLALSINPHVLLILLRSIFLFVLIDFVSIGQDFCLRYCIPGTSYHLVHSLYSHPSRKEDRLRRETRCLFLQLSDYWSSGPKDLFQKSHAKRWKKLKAGASQERNLSPKERFHTILIPFQTTLQEKLEWEQWWTMTTQGVGLLIYIHHLPAMKCKPWGWQDGSVGKGSSHQAEDLTWILEPKWEKKTDSSNLTCDFLHVW